MFTGDVKRAILETLAYSDIFEFPLQLEEIHRYLALRASVEQITDTLSYMGGEVETEAGFYFLAGRAHIVALRTEREQLSKSHLPTAIKYGHMLGALPFIRMVALTGSLAVLNVSKEVDFDYMLVTVTGRLWTARAFALLLNRFTRRMGHTLCPNLIVAETALQWPLHDLYSARELYQMIPIAGMEVYQRLIQANSWAADFLPNACSRVVQGNRAAAWRPLLELPLRAKLGDRFERWEMTRKVARLSKQQDFGEETVFTADVCQGNFHHHRKWTKAALQERLDALQLSGPAITKMGEFA